MFWTLKLKILRLCDVEFEVASVLHHFLLVQHSTGHWKLSTDSYYEVIWIQLVCSETNESWWTVWCSKARRQKSEGCLLLLADVCLNKVYHQKHIYSLKLKPVQVRISQQPLLWVMMSSTRQWRSCRLVFSSDW